MPIHDWIRDESSAAQIKTDNHVKLRMVFQIKKRSAISVNVLMKVITTANLDSCKLSSSGVPTKAMTAELLRDSILR